MRGWVLVVRGGLQERPRAMPAPMPLVPPVTTTTRPAQSMARMGLMLGLAAKQALGTLAER